jgi:hypothetical protein
MCVGLPAAGAAEGYIAKAALQVVCEPAGQAGNWTPQLAVVLAASMPPCPSCPLHRITPPRHCTHPHPPPPRLQVCPDNTLLSPQQLKSCIVTAPNKPLLKRESGALMTEDFRVMLPLERGKAPISDLQCTTSSEALLSGEGLSACGAAPCCGSELRHAVLHGCSSCAAARLWCQA